MTLEDIERYEELIKKYLLCDLEDPAVSVLRNWYLNYVERGSEEAEKEAVKLRKYDPIFHFVKAREMRKKGMYHGAAYHYRMVGFEFPRVDKMAFELSECLLSLD